MEVMMSVDHIHKTFGNTVAVNDASFDVRKGSFSALLGPNGSGKSTMLKICSGLLHPTSGSVIINGHDVHSDMVAAMSGTGCVIETPEPYQDRTPNQMLNYLCRLDGMNRESSMAETLRVLEMVGMADSSDRKMRGFSKGMRQRVVLAQALLKSPSLLLLDEPTSGLDPKSTIDLMSVLTKLNKDGTTILMSSHMLDEVSSVCDDVIIMNHGKTAMTRTMTDIRSESRLILHIADPLDTWMMDAIQSVDGVNDLKRMGDIISIGFHGDAHSRARLLKSLIDSGISVCGVEEDDPLKNTFLWVTGGNEQ